MMTRWTDADKGIVEGLQRSLLGRRTYIVFFHKVIECCTNGLRSDPTSFEGLFGDGGIIVQCDKGGWLEVSVD